MFPRYNVTRHLEWTIWMIFKERTDFLHMGKESTSQWLRDKSLRRLFSTDVWGGAFKILTPQPDYPAFVVLWITKLFKEQFSIVLQTVQCLQGGMVQRVYVLCVLNHFSHVWLCATSWTAIHQAPLSMGFSKQEYWRGLPCPAPGDLPNPGTEPTFLMSNLHWQVDSLPLTPGTLTKTTP